MIYKIKRTSCWDSSIKPCDEAFQKVMMRHDERTVSDPKELNFSKDADEWYLHGQNHRVENNHIIRDFPEEVWVIRIETLKALNGFIKKYGIIVLTNEEIEIYDDYRE